MSIGKIILGLIIAGVGYLIVWKSEWILNNFGGVGFAEQHMQTAGGSRTFYKLIGTILIIAGFFIATDLLDNLFQATLGSLFKSQIMK